jgi:predicted DsbA family dithiol-disulfide isomerase
MHAYWSEAADLGDEAVVLNLVEDAGLDREEARAAMDDGAYVDRVLASTRKANMHGINAIPAFVLDNRLLVLGAHPHEVFESAFEMLDEGTEE